MINTGHSVYGAAPEYRIGALTHRSLGEKRCLDAGADGTGGQIENARQ